MIFARLPLWVLNCPLKCCLLSLSSDMEGCNAGIEVGVSLSSWYGYSSEPKRQRPCWSGAYKYWEEREIRQQKNKCITFLGVLSALKNNKVQYKCLRLIVGGVLYYIERPGKSSLISCLSRRYENKMRGQPRQYPSSGVFHAEHIQRPCSRSMALVFEERQWGQCSWSRLSKVESGRWWR